MDACESSSTQNLCDESFSCSLHVRQSPRRDPLGARNCWGALSRTRLKICPKVEIKWIMLFVIILATSSIIACFVLIGQMKEEMKTLHLNIAENRGKITSTSEKLQVKPDQEETWFHSGSVGSINNPPGSCEEVKMNNGSARNGLYHLIDGEGSMFSTYCDMVTGGGGWTLVASVHENNMKGRCTAGDRWSSEQGNSPAHPHGDGFWGNRATYGVAASATSNDYKNQAYFSMTANDVMIWHVPNDTPLENFESRAFLKYHTDAGFLASYGGNLQVLFSKYYPMLSKKYRANVDNGPAIPVVWDRGDNDTMLKFLGTMTRQRVYPGFVQFRAINRGRNAFALCSGVRIRPTPESVDIEHACIGSTSNNIGHPNEEKYCGDFAALDWNHHFGVSVSSTLIHSVVMIFYR